MLLIMRKFRKGGIGWWSGREWPGTEICRDELSDLFDIPESVGTIWISLHDRPAGNRHEARVVVDSYDAFPHLELENEDLGGPHKSEFDHKSLDKVLEPYVGKSVYVQVEYEE